MPTETKKTETVANDVDKKPILLDPKTEDLKESYNVDTLPGSPIAVNNRMLAHGREIKNLRLGHKGQSKKFQRLNKELNDDGAETDPEFVFPSSKVRSMTNMLKSDKKPNRLSALQQLSHFLIEPSTSLKEFVLEGEFVDYLKNFLTSTDNDELYQALCCVTSNFILLNSW
ncbi:hypothetical protein K502DRAFT_87425 [Neoconidiobolus thromboides FSU 785]|nr:hypothetical protein K502DRAFT_87425 [Neoconidiobolus thromboides FSU 785]